MDREQIEQLHQQASEAYLAGDFSEALKRWEQLAALDPQDERAAEGIRLCRLVTDAAAPEASAPPEEPAAPERPAAPAAAPPTSPAEELNLDLDLGALPESPAPPPTVDEPPEATGLAVPVPPEGEKLEVELEDGLSVLGGAAPEDDPPAGVPEHDPLRQTEGIDFGDIEAESPIPLAEPVPVDEPRRGLDGLNDLPAPDTAAAPATPGDDSDLLGEVVVDGDAAAAPAGAAADDPAAAELEGRVRELLDEAREAFAEGRIDDAASIVARVGILDERNAEALAMRAKIDEQREGSAHRLEDLIAEGTQLVGREQYEDARECFLRALEISPTHTEAEHYLEQVEKILVVQAEKEEAAEEAQTEAPSEAPTERQTEGEPDPVEEQPAASAPEPAGLNHEPHEPEAGTQAVPLAGSAGLPPLDSLPDFEDVPEREEEAPAAVTRRAGMGGRLLWVGLVVVALAAAGWYFVPGLLGGSEEPAEAASAPRPERPARAAAGAGTAATEPAPLPQPAAAVPVDPAALRAALERARSAYERGDYEDAIRNYSEVLEYDPTHVEAGEGLRQAGERFHEQQEKNERLARARQAFEDRAFESALKLLYRMPDEVEPTVRDRNIVNGWYNLGIIELKGGDCVEAIRHFDEALSLDREDQELLQARAYAERYRDAAKDTRYYRTVEQLRLRGWVE